MTAVVLAGFSSGTPAERGVVAAERMLQIKLFGGVDLRLNDDLLPPFESARAESLLAYLLLHRDAPQSRQHLAYLLWPDSSESQARTNLRHVLHTLRHSLPNADRFLAVTPRTLQWRDDAPFWLDVATFEEATARSAAGSADVLGALRDAVALYTGDLLPAHYDEWLVTERERLRQAYLHALASLTALLAEQRDHGAAVASAERLLREDPLDERTYLLLMRLHDAAGNRSQALRVYHRCVSTLDRELGVTPSAAIRQAYEALLPVTLEHSAPRAPRDRIGGAPLVGRAAEWARLTSLWREAETGRAHLVLVSGEPGIGKTRLLEELRAWVTHRGVAVAEARSYAAEGQLPYGALVAWLRGDAIRERIARLDRPRLTTLARILPELRVEDNDAPLSTPLSEQDLRRQYFEAAVGAIQTGDRPLLLLADDLQWCDPPSLQFLHYLLRTAADARLLVAATARSEEIDNAHPLHELMASLHRLERVTEIPLDRLMPEETALLAARVAGRSFDDRSLLRLHAETEGNPLFVVEAVRAGWHADSGTVTSPKVQAVIEARLAQLSAPARRLVDVAATIGREFSPSLLAHAAEVDEVTLVRGLDELWRRRIIREQGADAYDFSHDKIREAAYQNLGPAWRRRLHGAVAQGLEQLHCDNLPAVSSRIAAHWERAGQSDQALSWYLHAAGVAQQNYANEEAIRLLDHARDLLAALPESDDRAAQEMSILAALPASLGWVEGWSSQRLAAVHRRALELSASQGMPLPSPLMRSLALTSLTASDFVAASQFGAHLRERGEQQADNVLLVESAYVLGIIAFWQGELRAAQGHFETAIDRYQPAARRAHEYQYGLDPKVICLSRLGNTLWFLGEPAAAVQARDEALALADDNGHPFSRETALVFAAMLAVEMHDLAGGNAYSQALLGDRGAGTKPTQIHAGAIAGFFDIAHGRIAPGMARLEQAVEETRKAEYAPGHRACMLRLLLAACETTADDKARLATAERMLALRAVRLWQSEARRQRAECLAAFGAPARAIESEFSDALQVARQHGARMLELRAAISLLRFRRKAGGDAPATAAADALAALIATMPAAQETPEAAEARALLS